MSKNNAPVRKTCNTCRIEKQESNFFKVDTPLFPDGRIDTCTQCVRKEVDVDDVQSVIGFLRQIDKPFYQKEWDVALKGKGHPLGLYIRKLGLSQYKGKTFSNSDGIDGTGDVDLSSINPITEMELQNGEKITYSDDLVDKWGVGYSQSEYMQMEKFYMNMKLTHDVDTATHEDMLKQLAYITVDRDRLRRDGAWTDYDRVSKVYETMLKSASFRPADRKGTDEATGMRTFSQIFEEVEKRGFRKPPPKELNRDQFDLIIITLANYYHRLFGQHIITEIPEEVIKEIDEFHTDDLTPDEIDDGDDQ